MRSPIRYFGGKSWLVPKLIEMTPDHRISIEGFCGAAWYTINKPKSESEIMNDINQELINFWMVVRDQENEFAKKCEMLPDSEKLYRDYYATILQDHEKNLIDRAIAFFYVNRHSFSGLFDTFHGMHVNGNNRGQLAWLSIVKELKSKMWERIKMIDIRCTSIFDLLGHDCDRDGVFIYLDPPYLEAGSYYEMRVPGGKKWDMADFLRLRQVLKSFKRAKILISIDNGEFFKTDGWHVEEVEKKKVLQSSAEVGRECLVYNYEPEGIYSRKSILSTFDPGDW